MRKTIRKLFMAIGVIGLVVWYFVYKALLRSACAAAGTPPEDCAFILPWELSFQQASYMVIVPGFVATLPFLLAFLMGGGSMTHPAPPQNPKNKDDG